MSAITRTVRLHHPRATVWAALTDRDALAAWLMPNDFEARVGHRFTFRTDPAPGFDGVVHCEVRDLVAPDRLAFTWVAGKVDTLVTFRLQEAGSGTDLHLRHEGFGVTQMPVRMILGSGWKRILGERLPEHLGV